MKYLIWKVFMSITFQSLIQSHLNFKVHWFISLHPSDCIDSLLHVFDRYICLWYVWIYSWCTSGIAGQTFFWCYWVENEMGWNRWIPPALSAVLPSKSLLLFASFERELLLNCMGSPKPPSEKAPCTFLLSNLSGIGSNFSDIIVKVHASFFCWGNYKLFKTYLVAGIIHNIQSCDD